jgi:hypothetical protein
MAIKKKKAKKKADPYPQKHSAQKMAVKPSDPTPESLRPAFAGISKSFGNLLERTRAYLGSGKKAEA